MNAKAIQHLATLEVLLEQPLYLSLPFHENSGILKPWFWDSTIVGTFDPLTVAQQAGWMQWTDSEVAVQIWQFSEQGTASVATFNNNQYCMEEDSEKILLSSDERERRREVYEDLLDWFNQNLTHQRNFIMRYNADYSWAAVVGQQPDGQWLAIAPNVPQETSCYVKAQTSSVDDRRSCDRGLIVKAIPTPLASHSPSHSRLKTLLEQLPAIQIYGWYDGGYNHIHDYQLWVSQAASQEDAIFHLCQQSGFVEHYGFKAFSPGEQLYDNVDEANVAATRQFADLDRFLTTTFPEMELYRFCLWDQEFLYFVSDKELYDSGDRVGLSLHSQFTYNP